MLNVGIHNRRKKREVITASSIDGQVVFGKEGKDSRICVERGLDSQGHGCTIARQTIV
jgi:hypothetical protein